ncbi:MAG: hypothetical protein IPM22_05200 [Betaproteobacteria bacterium]|nr:hypothetical protein [Betaproteobacteria bacterium]MCC7216980.1 hypothetical protein [Burkholderiales bacterium]
MNPRRRDVLGGAGLALLVAALPARAQRAGALPRIGYLTPANPRAAAFWYAGRLAELALAHRVPVFSTSRQLAEAGIFASYGANLDLVARRSATYAHGILKGAKPGDLPIELPAKFELVVNQRTADALGIAIAPAVLARADEVIR